MPEQSVPIKAALWERYAEARRMAKHYAELEAKLRAQVEDTMGEAETGTIRGKTVVTWKHIKSNRFDTTAFKTDHPDDYALYLKVSESRQFRPTDPA